MNTTKTIAHSNYRKGGKLLVSAKFQHKIQNFLFQIISQNLLIKIDWGKMDKQQAIYELNELCT